MPWGTVEGTAVWDLTRFDPPAEVTVAGGLSSYGVMGMNGNAWEWEESTFDLKNDNPLGDEHGLVGGAWTSTTSANLTFRSKEAKGFEASILGFRVVMIRSPFSASATLISMD